MDFSFLGKVLPSEQVAELRRKLLQKLDMHLYHDRMDSIPISCRIKPIKESRRLEAAWLPESKDIVAFMENYETMILTNANTLLPFLEKREPWQDFDVCIFDQEMTWCVALTHNDEVKFVSLAAK